MLIEAARPAYWIPDSEITQCIACKEEFNPKLKIHHCRGCGQGVCAECSSNRRPVPSRGWDMPVRVCSLCNAKEGQLWNASWWWMGKAVVVGFHSASVSHSLDHLLTMYDRGGMVFWLLTHQLFKDRVEVIYIYIYHSVFIARGLEGGEDESLHKCP